MKLSIANVKKKYSISAPRWELLPFRTLTELSKGAFVSDVIFYKSFLTI